MSDGDTVSFKKKPIKDIEKRLIQRKLSPEVNMESKDNNKSPVSDMTPVIDILKQTNSLLGDIKRGAYNKSVQRLDVYKNINTIPVATATQPTFDQVTNGITAGYSREAIYESLRRNASRIVIRNQGPGDLYVIYSSAGTNEFTTNESYIQEGDSEAFFNVYEARLRSPTANLQYDITETEIPVATTTITRAEKIETYNSISTVDFIGAIPINAMITSNITPPLLSNKYTIRGINIQSVQQIDFDLIFFSSAVFDTPGVLDTDTFLDSAELDMTVFPTFRINNLNQWRLAISDLVILYEDTDLTNTLHVGLLNLGPIPKLAGAAGAVQIDFKMSPRA